MKAKLLFLFSSLLLFSSFSYAETVYYFAHESAWYQENYPSCSAPFTGTASAQISRCEGGGYGFSSCRLIGGNLSCKHGSSTLYLATYTQASCPSGQELIDGQCQTPPVEECPVGYVRNEVGLCVLDPDDDFCSNDFLALEAQESNACAAQFPNSFTNFQSSCTSRENYSFSCSEGVSKPTDPTDSIDTPDSGFTGGNAGTSTPDAPDFDKTEPDVVTPEPETDGALLEAITNLNRDNNNALIGLNKDMNEGLTNLDNQMSQLNETNNAIGQSIVDQINQDKAIYEANKQLAMQQTGTIAQVGASLEGAIGSQTAALTEALGNLADTDKTLSSNSCSSFQCDGDAITCYIARQSWVNRCSEFTHQTAFNTSSASLTSDLKTISESSTNEDGAFKGVFADAETTADEALDAYTTANGFSFDGGCPAPRTYSVLGNPWTIDYSAFCQLALVFRFFIMASAALASFFMIAKHI